MSEVLHLDSVDVYNRLFGLETLHPLVSVVDLNKATRGIEVMTMHYGLYALFLKMEKACAIKYGRQNYDYQEGTIVLFCSRSDDGNTTYGGSGAGRMVVRDNFSSRFVAGYVAGEKYEEVYIFFLRGE